MDMAALPLVFNMPRIDIKNHELIISLCRSVSSIDIIVPIVSWREYKGGHNHGSMHREAYVVSCICHLNKPHLKNRKISVNLSELYSPKCKQSHPRKSSCYGLK